jgi:excisionase family DNA binding protein
MKNTPTKNSVDEAYKVIAEHNARKSSIDLISYFDERFLELKNMVINGYSEEDFINIKDASTFLDISVQTIYRLVSQDKIPFYKTGKKLYFLKSDLRKWIIEGGQKNYSKSPSELELLADQYLFDNKIIA